MSTARTANVSITNDTDGTATVQLFHRNDDYGTEGASWIAGPGETVGPFTVHFKTGIGSWGVLDWWAVLLNVRDGSTPGLWRNAGSSEVADWKECQLQSKDVDQNLVFTVSTAEFSVNLASGGCNDGMKEYAHIQAPPGGPRVSNVFVLMLENHSFDNIFGQSGIQGITSPPAGAANTYNGVSYAVGSPAPTAMSHDPSHGFTDIVQQLSGPGATYPPGGPYPANDMAGFVADFATSTGEGLPLPDPSTYGDVMLGFDTPSQLPVLYQLATDFAVCDHWFASLPSSTWPNRMFVHGASSKGLDHSPSLADEIEWETVHGFTFPNGSLYDMLTENGLGWRIYRDDTNAYSDDPAPGAELGGIPQVAALSGISIAWPFANVESLTEFAADLQSPYTWLYTFIEPNYGDVTGNTYHGGSSQHPMDDVYGGEGLIKAVYEAIRNSPAWLTSLLIVTYDEHGGFYDSVPPDKVPKQYATPPGDGPYPDGYDQSGFDFSMLGVRVPAVVVSPWLAQGSVDHTIYDHSSVAATVSALFGLPS